MVEIRDPAPVTAKVVNLFNRKSVSQGDTTKSAEDLVKFAKTGGPTVKAIDQQSIGIMNNCMEAVASGEVTDILIIGTGKSGQSRFWIAMPEGKNAQIEATRYLGQVVVLQDILKQVVYAGLQADDE